MAIKQNNLFIDKNFEFSLLLFDLICKGTKWPEKDLNDKIKLITMKKLILFSILVLSYSMAMAQKVFSFTFITSPQIYWLKSGSGDVINGQNHLGFDYGIEGDVFLRSERYAITTGLTVSSIGGSLTYKVPVSFSDKLLPAGTSVDYRLRYLEIPFALKLRSKDFNRSRFYAQFGLNNWLNIRAMASTSDGSFRNETVNDEVRFINIGLNVGGGIEYDLGNRNFLTGGLIYTGSFFDATKNSTVKDKTTLNTLRIRLGFVF
jgi:hypothetical protein